MNPNWPNAEEAKILRDSFRRAIPASEEAALRMYEGVFKEEPSVRDLFSDDLVKQQEKLVQSLAVCLDLLENPEQFTSLCQDLGARHQNYGTKPEHYALVARHMITAFGEVIQPPLSDEETRLWIRFINLICDAMKE